jgi:predicted nucleic acid-binding protein
VFVLDTNVVSELFKAEPDPGLAAWLEVTPPSRFFVTAISKAESLTGLAIMPEGKRKQALHLIMHTFFEERLLNPILPFGDRDAEFFAEVVSHRRRIGRPIGEFDAQIAAIARANSFAVVTRNVGDFEQCGIAVINPWGAYSP